MLTDESSVNQFIDYQRNAIRYHVIFAIGILVLGVLLILAGFLLQENLKGKGVNTIISIGGGFISSLSAFQLKEIIKRREKIGTLNIIKIRLSELEKKGKSSDLEELKRIKELIWKIIEKTSLG